MRKFPTVGFTATFFGSSDTMPKIVLNDYTSYTRTERVYYMFKRVVWVCPLPPVELAMGVEINRIYLRRIDKVTNDYLTGGSWINRKIGEYTEMLSYQDKLILRSAWLTHEYKAIDAVESKYNIWEGYPCTSRLGFILRLRSFSKHYCN